MSISVRQLCVDLRAITAVGAPLIINNLSSIGVGVADTMMAARLGSQQLAGVAIGSGVWIALFLLGLGTLMALGPTVAQHFGAGRDHDIGHDTRQGLWLALLISVTVIAVMRHMTPLFVAVGIEHAVAELAQRYLDWLSWGVPGAYGYHTLKQMTVSAIAKPSGTMKTMPLGFAMALTVRVGQAVGRQDIDGARRIGLTGFALCGLCTCTAAATTLLFAPHIIAVYTQDARIAAIALSLFKVGAGLQLADGLQAAASFALRGLKDTRVPLLLNALNYWGIGFTLAYGLGRYADAGAAGVRRTTAAIASRPPNMSA